MHNKLLLPNRFKKLGWCILIPTVILRIIAVLLGQTIPETIETYPLVQHIFSELFQQTIMGVLFIIGALLVGFAKEKTEDEFISNLRLSSLMWAVWLNYILLLVAFIFVYGFPFFEVMTYNMFSVLLIFIIRFNFILYKNSKSLTDETSSNNNNTQGTN